MSDMLGEGEELPLRGEDAIAISDATGPVTFHPTEIVIKENKLTFEEASKCLSVLGKDESGIRYAYLMLCAVQKKLTDVSVILNFKHLLFLDLTGNYLTLESLQVLVDIPFLILLKANRNKIESAALGFMPYLQVLCFNENQITETCDINQPMLDYLELHKNLICTAQFDVERLKTLKQLELRGNHLIDFSGTYPTSIQKLYIPDNKISIIDAGDMSKMTNLEYLHLRDNLIRKLNGFTEQLVKLNYLNLRNNKIKKLRQFRKLKCLKSLETLIVIGNPAWVQEEQVTGEDRGGGGDDDEDEEDALGEEDEKPMKIDKNRIALLVLLPQLKRINKIEVTLDEREVALDVKKEKYKEIMAESSSEEETEVPTTTDFTTEYTTESEKTEEEEDDEDEDEDEDEADEDEEEEDDK